MAGGIVGLWASGLGLSSAWVGLQRDHVVYWTHARRGFKDVLFSTVPKAGHSYTPRLPSDYDDPCLFLL
jgi:hypothetical protein